MRIVEINKFEGCWGLFKSKKNKERLGSSDEETVEQIRENPYLQYFLGLNEYTNKAKG